MARRSAQYFAGTITSFAAFVLVLTGCDTSTTGSQTSPASSAPVSSSVPTPTPSTAPTTTPPSSGLIAYTRFTGTSLATGALEASRLDGTGQVSLTRAQQNVKDQDAAWSPDGTKVAFDREAPKAGCGTGCVTREVFVVDVASRAVTQLTQSPAGAACGAGAVNSCHYDPSWSPDGTKIAYAGSLTTASGSPTAIWVADVDGTNAKSVTKPPTGAVDSGPSWSPDSASIAFNRRTGQYATVATIKADGTGLHQLTPASGHFGDHPAYSPDGTKILFRSNFNAKPSVFVHSELFTVTPAGTSLAPVTQSADTVEFLAAAWSPDGSTIIAGRVTHGANNDQAQLVTLNPDGSRVRVVLIDSNAQSDPDWSPKS